MVRHHAPLGAVSAGAIAIIALLATGETAFRLSIATAYVGLSLLALTLAIGPARILRGRSLPRSSDLRRDIGIWAGLIGTAHVVAGVLVHKGGQVWPYFLRPFWRSNADGVSGVGPLLVDRFGLANYTGLLATLVLAMLLALSNDLSMRRLGGRRWKSLHRLNYALFALVVLHGAVYQWLESRAAPLVGVVGLAAVSVLVFQGAGFRAVRADSRALTRVARREENRAGD